MPLGAFKTALMGAAGAASGGFVAFGGLISQWKGAATVITDSSAANNNGTTTGVRYSTAATKSGTYGLHSVDFGDPPRGHVRAPTMSALGMTTAFTVSCWAKADAHPATWTALFGQASTSSWGDGFGMYVSNTNTISGFVNGYSSGNVADIVTFTNWNHYVLTYDGSDLKLYINGSLGDTNSTNSGTVASNAIGIADLNIPNYSYTWPGVSDEYGFWNEALTASEITAIYNSGTPLSLSADSGNYASSANLKAYYKFEDPKTYRVHAFRGNGTFYVANGEADVDWLVVGGGGGGGQGYTGGNGGGGGAGAARTGTGYSVSAGTYAITVGVGGAGHAGSEGSGGQGGNSTALGTTVKGGGYASGGNYAHGGDSTDPNGGSSGGAGGSSVSGWRDHGTSGTYGNDGGSSIGQPVPAGGGGGGAGGAAQDAVYGGGGSTGGYGGAGSTGHYGITASTVGLMGGGGGTGNAGVGAGGSQGGGGGNATPEGGAVNSGSGGGGGKHSSRYSGDGGAGIVIIRYEVEV